MISINSLALILFVAVEQLCVHHCESSFAYISQNGYRKVTIAIDENVPENEELLCRIQSIFKKASHYLYKATRRRAYFHEIVVIVPMSWSDGKTEGKTSLNESIHLADIHVGIPDPVDKAPFVLNPNLCGETGRYVYLTPDYLMEEDTEAQYGPYEKVIAHEWAHLRWGLFDESPVNTDREWAYLEANGEYTGVRCSLDSKGNLTNILNTSIPCDIDPAINLPSSDCRWNDDLEEKAAASVMYNPYLAQTEGFCDRKAHTDVQHNRRAPNQQNRKCQLQSAWEVIENHEDFRDTNFPRKVCNLDPQFNIVKTLPKRTVLILDTSGSMMLKDRLLGLLQACRQYILDAAQDGEYVGIIQFKLDGIVLANLSQITEDTRRLLISKLPKRLAGGTNIAKGLILGLKVLSEIDGKPAPPNGGNLLVVSDGQEKSRPHISDIEAELIGSGVTIDSLIVDSSAPTKLEEISKKTRGSVFYCNADANVNVMNEALSVTTTRKTFNKRDIVVTLISDTAFVNFADSIEVPFFVDFTIGRTLKLRIGYNNNATKTVDVVLHGPNSEMWSSTSSEYRINKMFQSIDINLREPAKPGIYKLMIANPNNDEQKNVTVTVKSRSRPENSYPLHTEASWKFQDITPPQKQVLLVEVYTGHRPILNANVTAFVERPEAQDYVMNLYDNGAGADARKQDGIYSRFFTAFTTNGRYSVRVTVQNINTNTVTGSTKLFGRRLPSNGAIIEKVEETGNFQRHTNGGAFTLRNFNKAEKYYPPNDITDLKVTRIDKHKKHLHLEWTTPGSSLDSGKASRYEMFFGNDFEKLISNTSDQVKIKQTQVVSGNLTDPSECCRKENLTVRVFVTDMESVYWLAVWAYYDTREQSRRNNLSNIVAFSFRTFIPATGASTAKFSASSLLWSLIACLVVIIVVVTLYYVLTREKRKRRRGEEEEESHSVNETAT